MKPHLLLTQRPQKCDSLFVASRLNYLFSTYSVFELLQTLYSNGVSFFVPATSLNNSKINISLGAAERVIRK